MATPFAGVRPRLRKRTGSCAKPFCPPNAWQIASDARRAAMRADLSSEKVIVIGSARFGPSARIDPDAPVTLIDPCAWTTKRPVSSRFLLRQFANAGFATRISTEVFWTPVPVTSTTVRAEADGTASRPETGATRTGQIANIKIRFFILFLPSLNIMPFGHSVIRSFSHVV